MDKPVTHTYIVALDPEARDIMRGKYDTLAGFGAAIRIGVELYSSFITNEKGEQTPNSLIYDGELGCIFRTMIDHE